MNGTAKNYMNGSLLIGSTTDSGEKLQVTGTMKVTGNTTIGGDITISKSSPILQFKDTVSRTTGLRGDISWDNSASTTVASIRATAITDNVGTQLEFYTRPAAGSLTQAMILNSSGNLGLGVTPSAWGSGLKMMDFGLGTAIGNPNSLVTSWFAANNYYDGTNFRYKNTEAANLYQLNGSHQWYNAPSGTAGNVITFTQAMTLSASGFLGIGATSPEQLIHIKNNSGGTAYALIEGQGRKMYLGQDGTGATIYSDGAAPMWFSTNATERMRITSGGNVLIGSTTDSGEKLQVTGDMKVTGGGLFERTVAATALRTIVAGGGYQLTMTNSASSNYQYGWYIDTNDLTLRNVSSGVNNLIIASTGAATFSSNVISNGYFSSDAYRDSRTQFLIGYQGSNQIRMGSGDTSDFLTFFAGANERLRITSGGNVLVATTTDSGEKLQVTGTAKITGATSIGGTLTAPNIYASSGNVTIEANNWVTNGESTNVSIVTSGTEVARIFTTAENVGGYAGIGFKTLRGGGDGLATRLYISSTGAATFSSSVTAGGNLLLTAGSAASIGAINLIRTGTSPVASRMTFGTDGTGYSFAIGKNVGGTVTDLVTILDSGAATFSSSVTATQLTTTRATTSTNNYLQFTTGGTTNWQIGTPSSQTALSFLDGGVETFRLDTGGIVSLGGNFGIGGATFGTSATRTLAVTSGTAPSTSPADRFQLYSADVVAGNAAPHFRTENGAVIKLYQETTSVGNSIISLGGGNSVLDDTTFDGYTLRQIVKALRNQGILA
jgi:hypothetical protein